MRFQKRLLCLLTSVLLVVSLLGGFPASAANSALIGEGTDLPAAAADSSPSIPKFLIIGHSFSLDSLFYTFHHVIKNSGVKDYTVGIIYYPGCSLESHVGYAETNNPVYVYYKLTSDSGSWSKTENATMLTGLQDEPWDMIYLQEHHFYCSVPDGYTNDLNALMRYVNRNKTNPDAKFGWHMTWGFQETYKTNNTYSKKFVEMFQGDPLAMYNSISDTVQKMIVPRNEFVSIIPTGTAIQNARTSYFGDTLTRDDYHLNDIGRLIASHCWYATLTGKPLDTLLYAPSSLGLTPKDKQVIIEAVNNTLKTPYAVTPSAYPPTKAITLAGGKAEVNGERVTEAPKDATVTLRFDTTNKCTQFNGWEVQQGNVTLADPSNPVTTFVMPAESVYIRANNTNTCPSLRMTDVSTNGWYHNAVDYVLENGIMSGYDRSTFGTNDTLTRAQVVQVLYNKEGKPAVTAENQFKDVPADQWFFDAVRWAADKGVVSGVGDGKFDPNGKITLEQAAVILHNYSGKPSATAELNAIGNYSSWAADALRWCVANDLLKDIPFENATEAATRAQTAQLLYNYLSK